GEGATGLVGDGATPAGPARRAGAGTADGLVVQKDAVGNRGGSGHGTGGNRRNGVDNRAAPAELRTAADARAADGPVVRQGAVTDKEVGVARESDVRDGAPRAGAPGGAAPEATDRLVVPEEAVTDGHGAGVVHEGTAEPVAGESGAGAGRTPNGPV